MEGDAGQLAMQLEQSRTAVEPALISAAQNGPDPDTLLQIRTAAESRFDALEPWIVPNSAQIGLSANEIQLVQEKTRDQFVAETVQDFTVAYQSRALVGLGIIADNTAVQVLQNFAGNNASPLQAAAKKVLAGVFSAFSAQVGFSGQPSPSFELKAKFSLGANSDGINPATEAVILRVGTVAILIPPGSFVSNENDSFAFEGAIDDVNLEVQFAPLGNNGFAFHAKGSGASDLTSTGKTVAVGLVIGNDTGSTAASVDK